MPETAVTKGEFAKIIGVSAGRISQMIAAGQIDAGAMEGEGQRARIKVETAKSQLRRRMDSGQRFGNGLGTQLTPSDHEPSEASPRTGFRPAPAPPSSNRRDIFDDAIRAERLRALRNANRRQAEDEQARRGIFIRADESRAAMAKMAVQLVNLFEGGLADIATALASEFKLPQRDVLHTLRNEFRALRSRSAELVRRQAEAEPGLVDHEIGETDSQAAA